MEHDFEEYRSKRDFDETPEPRPGEDDGGGGHRFVIQKHDASNLHYDFRLEIGEALVSWAVPKGPSLDPSEKRLAVRTEDHPIEYVDFEGVIPEDEYGGGAVLVWDTGHYENIQEGDDGELRDMRKQIEEGHVTVELDGEKLTGGWAITAMGDDVGEDSKWLLVKTDDDAADARRNPTSTEPKSVLSDRSLEEVREEFEDDE